MPTPQELLWAQLAHARLNAHQERLAHVRLSTCRQAADLAAGGAAGDHDPSLSSGRPAERAHNNAPNEGQHHDNGKRKKAPESQVSGVHLIRPDLHAPTLGRLGHDEQHLPADEPALVLVKDC